MRLIVSTIIGFLIARFLLVPDAEWDEEKEIDYTIKFIMYGLSPRSYNLSLQVKKAAHPLSASEKLVCSFFTLC